MMSTPVENWPTCGVRPIDAVRKHLAQAVDRLALPGAHLVRGVTKTRCNVLLWVCRLVGIIPRCILDKAGSSNQCERIALMRRYLTLFGSGSIALLLADREFIGGRWIKFLLENNILFAIRVKENSARRQTLQEWLQETS